MVFGQVPVPQSEFLVEPLNQFVDLLSGMVSTAKGIAVCDRGAGKLMHVAFNDNELEISELVTDLDTPVDVDMLTGEWLILQEEAGNLLLVDHDSGDRRVIADGFTQPTAFALNGANTVYVVEFHTGLLKKLELSTGAITAFGPHFDSPADVLFQRPDRIIVADQVGLDNQEGAIYTLDLDGNVLNVEHSIIDPTGLTLSPSGSLYVTSFRLDTDTPGSGGVAVINSTGSIYPLITGLTGPTSLIFDSQNQLVILEEPTDMLYRYQLSGESSFDGVGGTDERPVPGGSSIGNSAGEILFAARLPDGSIAFIEQGDEEKLCLRDTSGHIGTITYPDFGYWLEPRLAADGQGLIYLADPLQQAIQVYDIDGNQKGRIDGIVPEILFGSNERGAYAIEFQEDGFQLIRMDAGGILSEAPLKLSADPASGVELRSEVLSIALQNGEIQRVTPSGGPVDRQAAWQTGTEPLSIAAVNDDSDALWILDSETGSIFITDDSGQMQLAAEVEQSGVLMKDDSGVLFMDRSGRIFRISRQRYTSVTDWSMY